MGTRVQSEFALHVYAQVFLGVDRHVGYTLSGGPAPKPVDVPDGIGNWYVRHADAQISDSFLGTLIAEIKKQGITGLSLASCKRISSDGLALLKELSEIEVLDLFNTALTDRDLEVVGRLTKLRSLNIAGTAVTSAGLSALRGLTNLEELHVGWTDIDDKGLAHLVALPSLKVLELRSTKVSDEGMREIARLPKLHTLGLQETRVGNDGVSHLRPLRAQLRRLFIGYTPIDNGAVPELQAFKSLRALMLRATQVDRSYDESIKAALPDLGGVCTGPGCTQEGLIR